VSNGGSDLTGYILYRGSQPVANLNATTTTYLDIGLASGTVYTYYVVAVNGVGPSAISAPVSSAPLSQDAGYLYLLIGICAVVIVVVAIIIVWTRARK
jgi:hypothetical protein